MCCLHNITNLLKAINDYVRLIIIVILDPQLLGVSCLRICPGGKTYADGSVLCLTATTLRREERDL
jgi:hypothetical protein